VQLLVALDSQVGAGKQIAPQRRKKACQQFQRGQFVFANFDALIRPNRSKPAFERAQHAPTGFGLFLRRVEAEDDLAVSRGGGRWIPFKCVAVFRMEADDGIVAAVYGRDNSAGCSKINSKKHNDLSQLQGGFATASSCW